MRIQFYREKEKSTSCFKFMCQQRKMESLTAVQLWPTLLATIKGSVHNKAAVKGNVFLQTTVAKLALSKILTHIFHQDIWAECQIVLNVHNKSIKVPPLSIWRRYYVCFVCLGATAPWALRCFCLKECVWGLLLFPAKRAESANHLQLSLECRTSLMDIYVPARWRFCYF